MRARWARFSAWAPLSASSALRARSRQVASRRRTPVIRRPTPQPRRMDGPRAHLGEGTPTSVGLPELIACDMARMGCWQGWAVKADSS
jgi:hypothetical protein